MATNLPRVSEILEWGLGDLVAGREWMQPRHRRRGRLAHAAAHIIALGGQIENEWWDQSSGNDNAYTIDSRGKEYVDFVQHEECRPYVMGVEKALSELDLKVIATELAVTNDLLGYQGHIDWIAEMMLADNPLFRHWVIDLKTGAPPSAGSATERWHRLQLFLYKLAYQRMHSAMNLGRAAIYLPGDGSYRFRVYSDNSDMAFAIRLAEVHRFRREI